MRKEDINKRVIEAIKWLLANTEGLNKTALADALGIKPAKFSEILNERMLAGSDIMGTLCGTFGISSRWILTGDGNMCASEPAIAGEHKPLGIPLLPVDAVAGVLSGNDMQVMEYDCEYFDVPTFKGAEFLIRVSGDSMQPKYYSGDIVACKRLPIDTFFQWNRVYVIGSEQGVILKRVRQGSDAEHITLVSENTDYAPFELPLNKVHSIALVVGVVRAE